MPHLLDLDLFSLKYIPENFDNAIFLPPLKLINKRCLDRLVLKVIHVSWTALTYFSFFLRTYAVKISAHSLKWMFHLRSRDSMRLGSQFVHDSDCVIDVSTPFHCGNANKFYDRIRL